tara:strand:+ start:1674 stop:1970 length:297 start_codon:yes stop_codon:yes gene_type:complete
MKNDMLNEQMMGLGSPAGGIMPTESDIQKQIDNIDQSEKQEAKQALAQILQVIAELKEQGASEEEIMQLLSEMGISIEQLEFAQKLLDDNNNELGLTI